MSATDVPVEAGRQAAPRHSWHEVYDAFRGADPQELRPEDLESFAEAAWWIGRLDEAIALRERSYAGFASAGERVSAARIALALTWDNAGRGAHAVAHGWFANASRLLEGLPESSEHAYLAVTSGYIALEAGGGLNDALAALGHAQELARRFGNRDVEAMALAGKGRVLIQSGEVERGLDLLDEATAAATCGELRPFATGLVYCVTLSSCQDLGDYRRAAEWSEAANRWCERLDVSGFPGACRVHNAEIARLRGDWTKAEQQALMACEELKDFQRDITASGYYEVGEVRRRRGDFAAAEEAYRQANEWGRDPQPGLALLRLAQGKVSSAVAGVERALEELDQSLLRVKILPARVEIVLAAGDPISAESPPTSSSAWSTRTRSATGAPRRSIPPCTSPSDRSCSPRAITEERLGACGERGMNGARWARRTRSPRRECS